VKWIPPAFRSGAWWAGYGVYIAFCCVMWFPAHWLLWNRSHAWFYVSWAGIIAAGLWAQDRMERELKRRSKS